MFQLLLSKNKEEDCKSIDKETNNNSTKLLVPRNGPNVRERASIEKSINLMHNIIMQPKSCKYNIQALMLPQDFLQHQM